MAILSRIADEIWEQYRKGMRSCLADSPVRVTVRTDRMLGLCHRIVVDHAIWQC